MSDARLTPEALLAIKERHRVYLARQAGQPYISNAEKDIPALLWEGR